VFDFSRIAQSLELIGYVLAALSLAPLFPFLYVVLRWRTEDRDRHGIGTYGMLLYFCTLSFLLLVAGVANLTYGWVSTTPIRPLLERLAWGMFLGSGLFLLLNALLLRLVTVKPDWAEARRVFVGFLMTVAGMVTLIMILLFGMTLFEEVDPKEAEEVARRADEMKLYASWALYYAATYVGAVVRMTRATPRG
jgi:hypothetical protein